MNKQQHSLEVQTDLTHTHTHTRAERPPHYSDVDPFTTTKMKLTHHHDDDNSDQELLQRRRQKQQEEEESSNHHHHHDEQNAPGPMVQRTWFRTLVTTSVLLMIVMIGLGGLASFSRRSDPSSTTTTTTTTAREGRNETRFWSETALRRKAPFTPTRTINSTTTATTKTIEITPWKEHHHNDTHSAAAAMAQRALTSACGKDSATLGYCKIQGTIDIVSATQLYQTFCPPWNIYVGTQSFLTVEMCVTHAGGFGGVEATLLTCNGKTSTIYGGFGNLPQSTPSIAGGAVTFPYAGSGYQARQVVGSTGSCIQPYTLGMYCPIAEVPCYVFAAWDASTCGGAPVQVCG